MRLGQNLGYRITKTFSELNLYILRNIVRLSGKCHFQQFFVTMVYKNANGKNSSHKILVIEFLKLKGVVFQLFTVQPKAFAGMKTHKEDYLTTERW